MKLFTTMKNRILIVCSMISLFSSFYTVHACDTSGYIIDNVTDNCDGTFTIDMTVLVGGFPTTSVGSTWGFYWNVDATVMSVSPPSLTSMNGTTLNAVITGMTIMWGDPVPSASQPFIDITAGDPSETFQVTVVVNGFPTMWNGGGMEANMCPGGPGTNPERFAGEICAPPEIMAPITEIEICPGDVIPLSVLANCSTQSITWMPGGLMGAAVNVSPAVTTTYTVTGSNPCGQSVTNITVIVKPLPEITPVEAELEACPGIPVVMEVNTENAFLVSWSPGGFVGNFVITIPPSLPITYTATAQNECDEATTTITINPSPLPEVDIPGGNINICLGDTIELVAEAMFVDEVLWVPGGGNTLEVMVSPDTTTEYIIYGFNECGVDTAGVIVQVFDRVTDTLVLQACEGASVIYNGIPLSAGSTSTFTFPSVADCDSVVTVIVEELPHVSASLELTTCEGVNVTYNGQSLAPGSVTEFTFTAANGCDSVLTVTVVEVPETTGNVALGACSGSTVTYNGQMLDPGSVTTFTFTGSNGCDSVVTVTVATLPVYDQTVNLATCTGTTINYNGQQLQPGSTTTFNFTTYQGCDSIVTVEVEELAQFASSIELFACTGTTATYNGQALDPGTVTDFTFTTSNGCDSVVTVTVNEVSAITSAISLSACTGSTASYNGQDLAPGSVTDFTFVTSQGCDSIVTVTVNELATYNGSLNLQACTGTTVSYNGQALQPGSTTDFTFSTFQGCDSLVTVTVLEIAPVADTLTLEACAGETVSFGGQQLSPGSMTDFTYTSYQGCDSIVTVMVEELPVFATTLPLQACTGSTVNYNGVQIPAGSTINFTLTSAGGCDSVVTVMVTELDEIEVDLELETCAGSTALYNGQMLSPGTTTPFTFQSYLGCDSIVMVTVTELAAAEDTLILDACSGTSVTFNGQPLPAGSTQVFNFITPEGCDSVLTVIVNELPVFSSSLTLQACSGSTVGYNGQQLAPNTVTDFTLTAQNGCDSVVTVTVNEVTVITEALTLTACPGETVTFNNQSLATGTVTDFDFLTAQGCDSILTVTVLALPVATSALSLSACEGTSVNYAGQTLNAGSITDVVLTGPNGCDSIVTVTVASLPAASGFVTLQGCEGEPLLYNGVEIAPGTSLDFILTAANGCDSVVTVAALEPLMSNSTSEDIQICSGETALVFGQPVGTPGSYSQTYTGSNGCDSIHTVNLTVTADLVLGFTGDITINYGETVVLNPIVNASASLTYQWNEDPTLSCTDCQNPVASPEATTVYTLTIFNGDNCTAMADIRVFVEKNFGVYVPNSFSPNGDGINDVFMVFSDGRSVSQVKTFSVFSRWGETVFVGTNIPPDQAAFGWDGSHRGEELDPAVFAWFAEVEFIDGTTKLFKGDVTLVK